VTFGWAAALILSGFPGFKNGATSGATTESTAKRKEGSPEIRGRILNQSPKPRLSHPFNNSKNCRPKWMRNGGLENYLLAL